MPKFLKVLIGFVLPFVLLMSFTAIAADTRCACANTQGCNQRQDGVMGDRLVITHVDAAVTNMHVRTNSSNSQTLFTGKPWVGLTITPSTSSIFIKTTSKGKGGCLVKYDIHNK